MSNRELTNKLEKDYFRRLVEEGVPSNANKKKFNARFYKENGYSSPLSGTIRNITRHFCQSLKGIKPPPSWIRSDREQMEIFQKVSDELKEMDSSPKSNNLLKDYLECLYRKGVPPRNSKTFNTIFYKEYGYGTKLTQQVSTNLSRLRHLLKNSQKIGWISCDPELTKMAEKVAKELRKTEAGSEEEKNEEEREKQAEATNVSGKKKVAKELRKAHSTAKGREVEEEEKNGKIRENQPEARAYSDKKKLPKASCAEENLRDEEITEPSVKKQQLSTPKKTKNESQTSAEDIQSIVTPSDRKENLESAHKNKKLFDLSAKKQRISSTDVTDIKLKRKIRQLEEQLQSAKTKNQHLEDKLKDRDALIQSKDQTINTKGEAIDMMRTVIASFQANSHSISHCRPYPPPFIFSDSAPPLKTVKIECIDVE